MFNSNYSLLLNTDRYVLCKSNILQNEKGLLIMKQFYHATDFANLESIFLDGILAKNPEGLVYLAETAEDAAKFVLLRGYTHILAVKVEIPDELEANISESFDHSQKFFKCRAFAYSGDITPDMLCDTDTWVSFELSTK